MSVPTRISVAKLRFYRQIIANMSDAMAFTDRSSYRFLERNEAHRRLFGYLDRDLIGKLTPAHFIGWKLFRAALRDAEARGFWQGEISVRREDGRIVHADTVFFPVRDDEGRTIAYAGCHRDIGPRKSAEERFRRATQELRFQKSLLESQSEASIDGILVVSPDGRILSRNRRFGEMWGIPKEVLKKGTDAAALRHALQSLQRPREFLARVRRLYRRPRQESRDEILLKDGRIFDRFSAPVLAEDGKILGRVWYFRDMTDAKRAEEEQRRSALEAKRALAELKRAQARIIRSEKLALMGMLVSGVAHEINNPINVVHGNLSLMRERCGELSRLVREGGASAAARRAMAPVPGMLNDALKAAREARDVIHEFRNFARDPRSAESMDLNLCVRETLAVLRKDLARVRVRLRLGRLPGVLGFHGQMNQVLLNLVKNAAEAMGGKGTLMITTSARARRVRVTVADTGPGISPAERERIFDPFYTTKEEGRGMGLGLSLCAAIVQNHGGTLTVSGRTGRGAKFTVELPAK